VPGPFADPFAVAALGAVPEDWLSGIKGQLIVASNGAILDQSAASEDFDALAAQWFDGNVLVGSRVGDGAATALADFRVRADGFSRFLLVDRHLTARQAGRVVQRILEIDTYRMMALLALPIARALAPLITGYERELSQVTTVLESAGEEDETRLLDRLTRLEAHIESGEAENHYRFSQTLGGNVNYELAMALSIPVVAALAAFAIRHVRQTVTRTTK
jgi:uncharacterized membrane-anchored protein